MRSQWKSDEAARLAPYSSGPQYEVDGVHLKIAPERSRVLQICRSRGMLLRIAVAVTLILGVLLIPQHMAWAAPETRSTTVPVESGQVIEAPYPITFVVASWDGDRSATLEVRGTTPSGTWADWTKVEVDEDSYDRPAGMVGVGAGALKVQIRVVTGEASNLRAQLIDTDHGPRKLQAVSATPQAAALGGYTAQPPIISRAQWGANEALRKGTPSFAPLGRIIVHHTVTPNGDANPAATVRGVLAHHTGGNGWDDIGYNFLIDQQGRIYEGRFARPYASGEVPTGEDSQRRGVIGAHAMNNNAGTVGIALLGTYTAAPAPAAQVAALERLIAWKGDRHNLDLANPATVVGHRDVFQTSCPGESVQRLLGSIRNNANAIKFISQAPGNTPGYWVAASDGRVIPYGNAANYGSMGGRGLNAPIRSMTPTPSGRGYWLMGGDGGIFSFGDAGFYGSTGAMRLNQPVVGMATTPSGKGYWLVASDGGIFSFGDAGFHGSTGAMRLNKPVVGMTPSPSGKGYWLVASDGGIFSFGDAGFHGSTGAIRLNQPVVGMAAAPSGAGYWLFGQDGGVFAFNTPYLGSVPMLRPSSYAGAAQALPTKTGNGYYVLANDGSIHTFGDARFHGAPTGALRGAGMALVPAP